MQSSCELLAKQQPILCDAVAHALHYAQKKGAKAEVAITKVNGLSISTRLKELENIEFNNDGALGISVYLGQKKGNASTSDLSRLAIEKTIDSALAIAQYTSPDTCAGLADKALLAFNAPDLHLYYPKDISIENAISLAKEIEQNALDYDKQIINSDGANFNAHAGIRVYGNTEGMLGSYLSSRYSLSCSIIAKGKNALEQENEYSISRDFHQLRSPKWIGEKVAQKALARLNPRKIPSQKLPIILMNDVATSLIGHFVAGISGGSLYRQASFLLNRLGTQVFPTWFEITERPHLHGFLASSPFDSEGVRTQDRTIIENGILQTYLLTQYSAKKLGLQTTGHAGGIYNWFVKPSIAGGLTALLKQMDKGLLITDLMGQGINLVTGDYSRGASGFWVEKGEIQYPVAEITIAGNLLTMLQHIIAVGDDIETRSNIQTGSILLAPINISGQ